MPTASLHCGPLMQASLVSAVASAALAKAVAGRPALVVEPAIVGEPAVVDEEVLLTAPPALASVEVLPAELLLVAKLVGPTLLVVLSGASPADV